MVIIEESRKRRVSAYIPKYISMAYYIMFLWIPGRDVTRSKVTGNVLVNALHAFHRFNRRYHVKNSCHDLIPNPRISMENQDCKCKMCILVLDTHSASCEN